MPARKAEHKTADQDTVEIPGAGLGRVAFTAYTVSIDETATADETLPIWDALIQEKPYLAAAWAASAQAVLTATFERNPSK